MASVLEYKKRNGFKQNYRIESEHLDRLNVPVEERIKNYYGKYGTLPMD